jgi:hypothetical protein
VTGDDQSVDREPRHGYYRRWLGHSYEATKRFFGLRVAGFILAIVGPSLGFFLLAWVSGQSSQVGQAFEQFRWAVYGGGGTVLILLGAYVVQFFRSPAAMERQWLERHRVECERLSRDLDAALDERRRLGQQLETERLEMEVGHEGGPLSAVDTGSDARVAFLAAEKDRYVEPFLGEIERERHRRRTLDSMATFGNDRELRKADAFVEEVESYLVGLRDNWVPALRAAAIDQAVTALRPVVRNPTNTAFAGVELQLRFPDDLGAGWRSDPEWSESIPFPPKPWGKQTLYSSLAVLRPPDRMPDPGRIERVEGEVVVTYSPFDLRAKRRVAMPPIRLFIPDSYAGTDLVIRWSAASIERHLVGSVGDELRVPVQAERIGPNILTGRSTD